MTSTLDVAIRPLAGPGELPLFLQLSYVLDHELADDLATGRRRPEWMWVALSGDRLVGRLAWWARPGGRHPETLDYFDLDDSLDDPERTEIGARLLATAHASVIGTDAEWPEYIRFIPPDWRDDPVAHRVVVGRMTVLERYGARLLVERIRLEWRPGTLIPEPTGRLSFRRVASRAELLGLMARTLEGTLDAHSRRDLAGSSPADVAAQQYDDEFLGYDSPQEWWTVAELPDGEPVGFVIPARNPYNPIIAYIGVLPAHRGNGYVDEILAEGTRLLAADQAPRIRASTDLGNVPMANAFARAGYVAFERSINMIWTRSGQG